MKKKRTIITVLTTAIACTGIIAMAGCGMFGSNNTETTVEETTQVADTNILEELANNEALVDTKINNGVTTEYFTDGTFVEYKNNDKNTNETSSESDQTAQPVESSAVESAEESKATAEKVVVHTPTEKVIRDKEGIVKVADVSINTEKESLIFKDNKIVIQNNEAASEAGTSETNTGKPETDPSETVVPETENKVEGETTTQPESNTEAVTENNVGDNESEANKGNNTEKETDDKKEEIEPVEEKIVDVKKVEEKDINYIVTEYEKETYDKAFEQRGTFVEDAKDTDEKIAKVIEKEVKEVVEEIKKQEEVAKKHAEEEAKAQEIKETEVKKDDEGNTVVTGKDEEGNKVEIVTDKQGNTEVKKTDDTGKVTVVAPIVEKPTQIAKVTEAPKPTQPKPTQPKPTIQQPKPTEASKPTQTVKPTETPKPTQPKPTQTVKPTEAPKPTQPKPTQPKATTHQHNWQVVYKTVHHPAVTHQEKYTVKEPYTYTEKEPYTYEEEYTYMATVNGWKVYYRPENGERVELGRFTNRDEAIAYYQSLYTQEAELNKSGQNKYCVLYAPTCFNYANASWQEEKTDYETKTGYKDVKKTGYKDVTKTRTVTDKAAYDEKVVDYYKCSCGETKR